MKEIIEKPHAIMFPYPLQGHVIPFVNLAIKLASNGFTITFINTESIHHQICQSRGISPEKDDHIFLGAHGSGLDTRYATINDGFPLGFDRSLYHDQFFEGIMNDFPAHVDEFIGKMVSHDPTINTLIVDTFYVWSSSIARKYNLVNISFFTEPALVLTSYYHVHLLKKNAHFASSTGNRSDEIDYIPGVKSIAPADLPSYLQAEEGEINTTAHRIVERCFSDAKKADFMLCNTLEEFEQETISALLQIQPFYSIGPVFPPKNRIATSLWPESDCTQWLDAKPRGSVLYVSFGSYAHTSMHVIEEVANGLLLSGVNFIWVVRPDLVGSDHPEVLPVGFEQRVEGRGLVVPWCCQMEVISHPSVGGFLTHCGWNSILESLWCGVPLICYPLLTDQFTNRKLVVDDLKVGINLCDKKSTPSRKGVAEKVNYLMRSQEIRQKIKEVGKLLVDATEKDGSSVVNFNRFVEDLMAEIATKKGSVVKDNLN